MPIGELGRSFNAKRARPTSPLLHESAEDVPAKIALAINILYKTAAKAIAMEAEAEKVRRSKPPGKYLAS
jgi:hypothetical protein